MSSEAIMESDSQPSPQTKPKLFCFVLMPFSSDFDDVYQIGIKEACEAAGAYCERVDEQHYNERMLERIYNQIAKADLIIADMTGKNANVFYEVGYAHALGKPTVLLTRNAGDIPFDLTQFPHIIYESKLTVLREKLSNRVLWHVNHPTTGLADTKFPLTLHVNGRDPSKEQISLNGEKNHKQHSFNLSLTFCNRGLTYLEEQDFKIGLLDEGIIKEILVDRYKFTKTQMINGGNQFVFPSLRGLMQGEFLELNALVLAGELPEAAGPFSFTLRIFTKSGTRDFKVNWAPKH